MIITIPDLKCPSWNTLYAQGHWGKRSKLANELHLLVRAALDPDAGMFDVPVDVTVTVYRSVLIDADNIPAKLLIDGLKGFILRDDDPAWVQSVTTRSRKGKRPHVVIEISEAR